MVDVLGREGGEAGGEGVEDEGSVSSIADLTMISRFEDDTEAADGWSAGWDFCTDVVG